MIVLDTNVLSELMKETPADAVMRWIARTPAAGLYTTSITQAEILHGIMLLPAGKRRSAFAAAAEATFNEEFSGRILPFGSAAASSYATIAATRQRAGRPISHLDAQIAAIAHSMGGSVATRNVKDFDRCDIRIVNPWDA
ncbi:MAG: type II toxin-antitoxin system VapC family toxin [Casimicrobiaceae bacterium]